MLSVLGVWDKLQKDAEPIRDILVRMRGSGRPPSPIFAALRSRRDRYADGIHRREPPYPQSAPRLRRRPRTRWKSPVRTRSMSLTADRAVSKSSSKTAGPISTSLFVAAEGRDSPSRDRMGIGMVTWSYPQRGIVATVRPRAFRTTARPTNISFHQGPFAILPMTGNRSSLVWTEQEHLADSLLSLSLEDFETRNCAPLWRASGQH